MFSGSAVKMQRRPAGAASTVKFGPVGVVNQVSQVERFLWDIVPRTAWITRSMSGFLLDCALDLGGLV